MADDLQHAAESGHTQSGGQLTPVTRVLVGGTGALLRAVPIGKDVKETAAGLIAPPELSEEERVALTVPKQFEGLRVRPTSEATVSVGGTGAASSEELARSNVYVKYSKSGQPTYLGKSPDANLNPGEAIIAVNKKTGEVRVQNTSGLADSDALGKFGKHAKENFAPPTKEGGAGKPPEPPEEKFVPPHPEYETSPPGSPANKQINEWADRAAKGDEVAIQSLKKIAAQKIDAQDAKFAQQKLDALEKPDYKAAGEKHGADFRGIQKGYGKTEDLAIFNDKKSGTSVAVPLSQWSPDKLKEHLDAARTRMGIKEIALKKGTKGLSEGQLPESDKKTITPKYLLDHENRFDPNVYTPEQLIRKGVLTGMKPETKT